MQEYNKKSLSLLIAKYGFILQIIFAVFLSFWILFNHQPKTGDDVEHLHSAWLVFNGKVPYNDFFQHHNPLLWYIYAPLLGFMAYDIAVFDVVRIISTLILFLNLYIIWLIVKRFMSNSYMASLISIASIFPSYVIYSGQDFRPDNYMVFCLILGLFYLLSYLDQHKVKSLVISFSLFALSFFFMQKIIFTLAVVGLIVVYLLIKNK